MHGGVSRRFASTFQRDAGDRPNSSVPQRQRDVDPTMNRQGSTHRVLNGRPYSRTMTLYFSSRLWMLVIWYSHLSDQAGVYF